MKTYKCIPALIALILAGAGLRVSADEDHPTLRAVHHYTHRKVVRASNSVRHVRAHYHNWKSRKGHKIRAWLNSH